jgi:protein gp37
MSGFTSISWTNATWNPVAGCTRATAGCDHCYAFALHDKRHKAHLAGQAMPAQYAKPYSEMQLLPERLSWPGKQKKPMMIFVNSMSDLFHSDVPEEYIRQVFAVMRAAHWHTFQVLTKRAGRLRQLGPSLDWPSNVWMGVSIEMDSLVKRADALREGASGAAIRFLSCEPLLGPLPSLDLTHIDWVIAGAESGAEKREMRDEWVRQLRDKTKEAGKAFFFKQRIEGGYVSNKTDKRGFRLHVGGTKREYPLLDGVQWSEFPEARKEI